MSLSILVDFYRLRRARKARRRREFHATMMECDALADRDDTILTEPELCYLIVKLDSAAQNLRVRQDATTNQAVYEPLIVERIQCATIAMKLRHQLATMRETVPA